jgi:hypothetical protein
MLPEENSMKSSNYSKAKVLTLIPVIVPAAAVICLVLAAILEDPSYRSSLYTIFALTGLMSAVLSPLPCLVMSAAGTAFAAKAVKEGIAKARTFFILGIIEILVHAAGAFLAIMIFIAGQGV